jgi:hypothetical protein
MLIFKSRFSASVVIWQRGKKVDEWLWLHAQAQKEYNSHHHQGLPVCVSRKLMILFSFFLSFAFVINSSSSFCCCWCCCVLVGVLSFPTNYGWLCNL